MTISEDRDTITMRAPDNWHAHFREFTMMVFLIGIFIKYAWRARVVAEPNLTDPNVNGRLAMNHKADILREVLTHPAGQDFEPVACMQITEATTRVDIEDGYAFGVRVFKVYPRYVTTNSKNGVVEYKNIYEPLKVLEELSTNSSLVGRKLIVQFHAEHPSFDIEGDDKEPAFLDEILAPIIGIFPYLNLTVEHIKTAYGVNWIKKRDSRIGASVTIQHLTNTIDDLTGYSKRSGGLICVHDGFKPQAGKIKDRDAIRKTVIIEKHPRFWYGGDDAWHPSRRKHCCGASCGAANTLATLPLLVDIFERFGNLLDLEPFLSEFGANFYGYPISTKTLTMVRRPWTIPAEIQVPGLNDVVIPWRFGEEMPWQVI